ncbi:MAG: phosphoribosylformylglycinamidine synthase subunit PurS [Pseudomonadota bacterium]|nr:phosphoribosylformylglycinamidine synthase subunit PurS [Pseudomonadota bacterium]MEC8020332.1 phosphoribosylformylglycinamidine synthase subunit PurS [Pseudomonadota bacterium]MEC8497702.1 phosphoribosylformylglycinamidine synthase subunit PurS [Pseudomonadota bacterium]|tara:strand:- start:251 stop:499 length:249 start_codon:yes stop_codon:yes gene_type:complete
MKALVKIMPKKGVLDPQGKAIEKSLNQLGFSQINSVIQGKLIEIEIDSINESDAQKIVDDASKQLLANLVIEDYEITITKDE